MNRITTAAAMIGVGIGIALAAPTVATAAPVDGWSIPLTPSAEQAIAKAEDYLDYTAFSPSGLVKQLEYEGFSTADATYAVNQLDVDWSAQAVKKAEDYLDYTAFSLSGLVEQLEYEGFSPALAQYGATIAYSG